MITNKRELRKAITKILKRLTGEKFKLQYTETKTGNSLKYFGYEVIFEKIEGYYSVMFCMTYAKKDYFKEGFILHEEDIEIQCEDLAEEIIGWSYADMGEDPQEIIKNMVLNMGL
jgi:hypothetical protein